MLRVSTIQMSADFRTYQTQTVTVRRNRNFAIRETERHEKENINVLGFTFRLDRNWNNYILIVTKLGYISLTIKLCSLYLTCYSLCQRLCSSGWLPLSAPWPPSSWALCFPSSSSLTLSSWTYSSQGTPPTALFLKTSSYRYSEEGTPSICLIIVIILATLDSNRFRYRNIGCCINRNTRQFVVHPGELKVLSLLFTFSHPNLLFIQ